ncbi:cupin domain-containing protein [Leucothrix arctica]|nr:cupin domain-containing protein [Leucothrix arctica]
MSIKVHNIQKDFVVLSPEKTATVETADSTLYQRLEQNYQGFKGHEMIAAFEFESDWDTWEIHPNGDEIVMLMSGEITFVLKLEDGEQTVDLKESGTYIIVPKGVWHTAKTTVKSKLLFITPGEGTKNAAEP